ncbi:MAG: hypothetical protein NTX72_01420 [Candidatus Uhrbacteria bacterium]|nr:hypothetical protein [Candidatus Uhrbacteria bacterium]
MSYAEAGGYRAGGAPVRAAATKFDVMYPANGDSEAAALYLREIYRGRDVQPKIDEFEKVPLAKRTEDKQLERQLEMKYKMSMGRETTATEEGGVLEQFLICESDRNDWLGGSVFRTTKFDDFKGIDAVLEWDEADRFGRYPRLLVDYTTSQLPERVAQKKEKLVHGGRVEYFRSPFELDEDDVEKEFSLYDMPVVILGIEKTFMPKIAGMAKSQEKGRVIRDGKKVVDIKQQAFSEHPLQILLLEQAIAQVDVQVRAAAARLLNLEKTIGDREAASTLDALRFRIGGGRVTASEIIDMLKRIEPNLHAYQEKNKDNDVVRSHVTSTIPKWENVAAVYQLLTEKMGDVQAKKNADQLLAARAWRNASVTHKLLTRV